MVTVVVIVAKLMVIRTVENLSVASSNSYGISDCQAYRKCCAEMNGGLFGALGKSSLSFRTFLFVLCKDQRPSGQRFLVEFLCYGRIHSFIHSCLHLMYTYLNYYISGTL